MNAVLKDEDKKREATSIKIDPNLWKDAKIEAIKYDMTVSDLVEEAIGMWIKKKAAEKKRG